jgi:NADH-quinone oxidoreductase subunit E
MGLPDTLVASVASFYTMLHRKPVGRHLIQVCTNISCSLLGAEHLLDHVGHKLGIRPGETTPDGKLTLMEVECLGSCGTGPMMQVDDQYYENLTVEKIDQIPAPGMKEATYETATWFDEALTRHGGRLKAQLPCLESD